jgi:isopenicillin-N epimerase
MATPSPEELRREHLLDPEVAFLNHGSFGACPRPVFERYQAWQRELENEPIDFFDRRLPALLDAARGALADYVGCSAEDLAFVQNATTGVNLAARALGLGPGDEVLATNLEYGACDLAWDWVCRRAEARYVRAPIPLPLRDPSEVADAGFAYASDARASSTTATSRPRPGSSCRSRRSSPAPVRWASPRSWTARTRPPRCP